MSEKTVDSSFALLRDVAKAGLNTWLFRRPFELPAKPREAVLKIYAEQWYHVWVNGQYLGRGPTFHHPTVLPLDSRPLTQLQSGRNVIAVLVQHTDVAFHNHVPTGEPGLVAQLTVDGRVIDGDEQWRMTDQSGWRNDSPRRSWAVDYVEEYEMANAPLGWQQPGFDDSGWRAPQIQRPATKLAGAEFIERPIPPLRIGEVSPVRCTGVFHMNAVEPGRPASSGALAASLSNTCKCLAPVRLPDDARDFTIDAPLMACFDLGREYVGQVVLECECPGDGIIDIGFSEVIDHGRPVLVRKGVGYVDRIYAARGTLKWEPIQFSGFRYISVTFRNFTGPVRVKRVCCRATEPDVQWPGHFHSSDETLNAVFDLCALSQRIGTQDGQMDCPTREQAPYIGDGVLTARWFAELTGDVRHYRWIVREQFRRQSPRGLVRSSIMSGSNDTIVDYTLLGVIAVRDYLRYTGDVDTARELLPKCRKAVGFFDSYRKDGGLCTWTLPPHVHGRIWENRYDPALPSFGDETWLVLFIDHPGLGWHNKNEAGIDRRGHSAALNALIVMTERAVADLEDAVGDPARGKALRAGADRLAGMIAAAYFDHSREAFVDGALDGRRLEQISEQTNAWCIAAGCLDDKLARQVLERLLRSDDPFIARAGPYFWSYLYPQLARLGLHELALEKTRTLWGQMLAGGATTLWETFLGDDLDTWCHPWSGAPIEFLLTHILGLPPHDVPDGEVTLRPRTDLLTQAKGSIYTRLGWFSIEWQDGKVTHQAPPGVHVKVIQ